MQVMVYNPTTDQYEPATPDESECILEVIDEMNKDCVRHKAK